MEGSAQARTGHWEPYKINGLGPRNGQIPRSRCAGERALPYHELSVLCPGSEGPVKPCSLKLLPLLHWSWPLLGKTKVQSPKPDRLRQSSLT